MPPLTFKLDEVGWQVAIPTASAAHAHGRESVRTTTERAQAQIYGELVSQIACDPSVDELLFFGLVDEPNLDRWQAALVRADRTRRPAWATVRSAVETGCTDEPVVWRHTERVVGARVVRSPGARDRERPGGSDCPHRGENVLPPAPTSPCACGSRGGPWWSFERP